MQLPFGSPAYEDTIIRLYDVYLAEDCPLPVMGLEEHDFDEVDNVIARIRDKKVAPAQMYNSIILTFTLITNIWYTIVRRMVPAVSKQTRKREHDVST
jgi:hypothetical protein